MANAAILGDVAELVGMKIRGRDEEELPLDGLLSAPPAPPPRLAWLLLIHVKMGGGGPGWPGGPGEG